MSKREAIEERKFKEQAEERWDAEVIKLTMIGRFGRVGRGDKLVLLPCKRRAIVLCFEFKQEGKSPTKIQLYYKRRFKRIGVPTYVVYTAKEAIKICKKAIRAEALSKGID